MVKVATAAVEIIIATTRCQIVSAPIVGQAVGMSTAFLDVEIGDVIAAACFVICLEKQIDERSACIFVQILIVDPPTLFQISVPEVGDCVFATANEHHVGDEASILSGSDVQIRTGASGNTTVEVGGVIIAVLPFCALFVFIN